MLRIGFSLRKSCQNARGNRAAAIESSIRRVINLRLKGNGIFWDPAHAEAMLQVRSLVISQSADERLAAMRVLELRQGRQDWRRTPRHVLCFTSTLRP